MNSSLRESKDNNRAIPDSTALGIYCVDLDGVCTFCNTSCCQLLGYSNQADLLGQHIHALIHPTPIDGSPCPVEDCQLCKAFTATDNSHVCGADLLRKDRSSFLAECWAQPINFPGQPPGYIVAIQDITERSQSEEDLRKTHALYAQAEQMGKMGHWEWNHIEYKMSACSEQFAQIYGMTVEAAVTHFSDREREVGIVHPADRERYEQELHHSETHLVGTDIEYRINLSSGELRHVHQRSELVLDVEGGIISSFGTVHDITEYKQAKQALQSSEERYRALYDNNPTMLFSVDQSGTVLSVNQFGIDQLGYSRDHLVGLSVMKLFHDDDKLLAQKYLQDCFADPGKVHTWELRKIHKDGKSLWVRETVRVVNDADNQSMALIVCEDITETRRLSEQLSYQASHDALTALVNRRGFERRLVEVLEGFNPDHFEHTLCYMDLDQFKVVNDTSGHSAGDEMLRQLGRILQEKVRKGDTLARLGGDEFGILMENCPQDQAQRVLGSMMQAVQDFHFSWEGRVFRVGMSVGMVAIDTETASVTELLRRADSACYMAKDQGRNRIQVYRSEDTDMARRHGEMQWVTRLYQALEENRFCMYAQAIVPLDTCSGTFYELLIRMKGENGQVVQPAAFLPAAERYNLIGRLDAWVIKNVFALLAANPGFLDQIDYVSINLSGQSLTEDDFLHLIIAELKRTGVDRSKICFEITETAAISSLSAASIFISTLRELGCRFALDDFGSGLSSFGHLKNLSVDYLKIDGMFVSDIVTDPIARAMVKSINEIGQVMGMQTVAEFVENNEIKQLLREIGVDYAQGYGIGKPQAFEQILHNYDRHSGLGTP